MRANILLVCQSRGKIEEETKGMTSAERTAYFNQAGETAAQKYGFRRIPSTQEERVPQQA